MVLDEEAGKTGLQGLSARLSRRLVGLDGLIDRLLVALLTGGHVLIEGAPGLAKTRSVKVLAAALDAGFARVQCTPDLMPADILGMQVYRPDTGRFDMAPGPVFHNLVLVDEINRAPPKVQSALLEAMAERQATIAGQTLALPDPFMVIATQNPIEHEGTYPLPEAQLDRFMFHLALDLPDAGTERRILDLVEAEDQAPPLRQTPLPLSGIAAAQEAVRAVHLAPELRDYIVRLVMATRDGPFAAEVEHAVSPRGSLALAAACKAHAWLQGRDFALPEDAAQLAPDILAHRLRLQWRAVAEGRTARALVADILGTVEPL